MTIRARGGEDKKLNAFWCRNQIECPHIVSITSLISFDFVRNANGSKSIGEFIFVKIIINSMPYRGGRGAAIVIYRDSFSLHPTDSAQCDVMACNEWTTNVMGFGIFFLTRKCLQRKSVQTCTADQFHHIVFVLGHSKIETRSAIERDREGDEERIGHCPCTQFVVDEQFPLQRTKCV